jgi:hypothetical protein
MPFPAATHVVRQQLQTYLIDMQWEAHKKSSWVVDETHEDFRNDDASEAIPGGLPCRDPLARTRRHEIPHQPSRI